eukprot:6814682-Karenia_brevis.AAC.1
MQNLAADGFSEVESDSVEPPLHCPSSAPFDSPALAHRTRRAGRKHRRKLNFPSTNTGASAPLLRAQAHTLGSAQANLSGPIC